MNFLFAKGRCRNRSERESERKREEAMDRRVTVFESRNERVSEIMGADRYCRNDRSFSENNGNEVCPFYFLIQSHVEYLSACEWSIADGVCFHSLILQNDRRFFFYLRESKLILVAAAKSVLSLLKWNSQLYTTQADIKKNNIKAATFAM